MKVTFEEEVDAAAWTRLVEGDPQATPFHTRAWLEAWAGAYPGHRPGHFIVRSPRGDLVGGLPAFRSRRFGLTQLLSLPYGAYGGPVADAPTEGDRAPIREALVRAWVGAAQRPGVVRAHLVLFGASGGDAAPAGVPAGWFHIDRTRILDLSPGFDRIWAEAFHGKVRNDCRRAEKLGVTAAREAGEAAAPAAEHLYGLQAENWKRHTPFHADIFYRLAKAEPDRVGFWVARHEERPVAVQVVLRRGVSSHSWLTVNDPGARKLQGGVLSQVAVIRDLCAAGCARLNFGSSAGSRTIDAYKASFGGVEWTYPSLLREAGWFRPFHYLYYRLKGVN